MLGTQLPFLVHLPVERNRITAKLRREMAVIAADLLEKTRREKRSNATDENTDKSVIGLLRKDLPADKPVSLLKIIFLVKAEEEDAELHMNQTEVLAQVRPIYSTGPIVY
jgi:hypothetical protein